MDWIERTVVLFRRGFEMITDMWPVKLALSALTSVFCFLFGGSEIILVVVMVFIALDTVTKWAAVTRKYLIDQGNKVSDITTTAMICGFFYAWQPGYLTSSALRQCWGEKFFTYGILIIFAGMMPKLPEINLFGLAINKSISGGIYTCIAMTELFSITENLEEMGNTRLAQFKQFLCNLSSRLTGGGFSMTLTNQLGNSAQQVGQTGGVNNASSQPGSHPDNG